MKSKEERKKDKQKKQNKWQMNRELYLCSLLMLTVFAGMIWYLADYVSSNQEALFNNSYNSQQRVLAQENTRGTIYAGTGEVLAQTVIAEDGTSVREYPYKNIFAHVVGYTDKGKTGIEELENYRIFLTGKSWIMSWQEKKIRETMSIQRWTLPCSRRRAMRWGYTAVRLL